MDPNKLQLLPPQVEFTDREQAEIATALSSPLLKRYLQTLIWTKITTHANYAPGWIAENRDAYVLEGVYMRGFNAALNTLLTIERLTETNDGTGSSAAG